MVQHLVVAVYVGQRLVLDVLGFVVLSLFGDLPDSLVLVAYLSELSFMRSSQHLFVQLLGLFVFAGERQKEALVAVAWSILMF